MSAFQRKPEQVPASATTIIIRYYDRYFPYTYSDSLISITIIIAKFQDIYYILTYGIVKECLFIGVNMEQNSGNRIKYYNFILCILVILIHAENSRDISEHIKMLNTIEYIYGGEICQTGCREGFFLCSGYLFYRNFTMWTNWGAKWKKPFFSTVIPLGYGICCTSFTLRPDEVPVVKQHIREIRRRFLFVFIEILEALLFIKV